MVDHRKPDELGPDGPAWFEVADAVYLAPFLTRAWSADVPSSTPTSPREDRSAVAEPERKPGVPTSVGTGARPVRTTTVTEHVVVSPNFVEGRPEPADRITAQRSRPVLDVPGIVRGLRPLRRKTLSPRADDIVLDEHATAARAVQDELWLPLTRRATERWLDLTLVVDSGPSMALWRTKVNSFEALLRRLGIFRTIQRRLLDTSPTDAAEPILRGGTPTASQRSLGELLDPSGRRVVLVLTDGVSRIWQSPHLAAILARLGTTMPTALVHLLPQRLWRQTGLDLHRVRLRPHGRLAPNGKWGVDPLDVSLDSPAGVDGAVPVPVLEMEGRWLGRLAHLLVGRQEPVRAAVILARGSAEFGNGTDAGSARDQVTDFLTTASPVAFRLATLLAAVPINLRTVCRIQAEVVPEAGVEHIAEVLGSSLFRPAPQAHVDSPWDQVSFTIQPEVRGELLSSARRSETARVMRIAFPYGHIWKALDSPDRTPDPSPLAVAESEIDIERIVMEALSGPYLARAVRLGVLRRTGPAEVVADRGAAGQGADAGTDMAAVAGGHQSVRLVQPDAGSPDLPRSRGDGGSAGLETQIWGSVPPRNPNFTGRTDLLSDLARAYGPVSVLYGAAGAGKTETAVEYIYLHVTDYDIVWWIEAGNQTQIRTALTELAVRLKLPEAREARTAVPAVREALQSGSPYQRWLLVFDSAEAPDVVLPYFPAGGTGDILVTSRDPNWAAVTRPFEVFPFDRHESVELLRKRWRDIMLADADLLAEKLGDLPLTLEQAAAWLVVTGSSVARYVELFDEKVAEILSTSAPGDLLVVAGWAVLLDDLQERDPAAYQLLEICAFFSPESIPWYVFTGVRGGSPVSELDKVFRNPMRLARVKRGINNYSLARVNHRSDTLQPYPSVQRVLRSRMPAERQRETRHSAHLFIANADPNDPLARKEWERYQAIKPHAYASDIVRCDTGWAQRHVVINLMRFLFRWGDYEEALRLAEYAVEVWRSKFGDDNSQTVEALQRLAFYHWIVGRFDEAFEINNKVLDIHLRLTGEHSEETLTARLAVAGGLRTRGDFATAARETEDLYHQARSQFGPNDPTTLVFARNHGISMRFLGEYQRAEELDRDTYNRLTEVLGQDHPETLSTLSGLILDRREAGDYLGARADLEELAVRAREIHGEDNADTLRRLAYLAVARRKAGDHVNALELSTDVLDRYRIRYGGDGFFYNIVACELGRSMDLRNVGDLDQAKAVGQSVLEQYRQCLGEDHPFTKAAEVDLAVTLRWIGDLAAARAVDEHALESLRAALGPDHVYTVVCAINLASDLAAEGDTVAAFETGAEATERARRTLGVDHPTTLAADLNHLFDKRSLGLVNDPETRLATLVSRYRRVLGDQHPATISAARGVRADCEIDPLPL